MEFTEHQLRAIGHTAGNLQIIACAGSGKTEVVARRVATLLKDGPKTGLKPSGIVAFTFTDRAVAELKERIVTRCRDELGQVHGMAEMFVGTIHAFCLELLKTEVPRYLKFDVLNEVQQSLFIDRHSRRSGLTASTDLKGIPLKRYTDTGPYLQALSILREDSLNKARLANCTVVNGLASYSELLQETRYLDFSSVMEAALGALKSDKGIRQRLANRVRHVIVDEYQDVNPIQEAIVSCLHTLGAKVCVVGDDDQTIYQWRGSDVENILTFSVRYPGVTQIRLEENFRSTEGIVETARGFVAKNTARLPKKMQPTTAQTFEPGDMVALSFDSPDAEASYIAETMKSLRGVSIEEDKKERGISWSDMAVLLRSVSANGEPITRALARAHIPHIVVGMNNLFSTAEAEAARQLFYFMVGRTDAAELATYWKNAGLGVEPAKLERAIAAAESSKNSLSNPTERFGFYSIQRTFLTFLEDAGIREELVSDDRGEVVFYNLGKFRVVS